MEGSHSAVGYGFSGSAGSLSDRHTKCCVSKQAALNNDWNSVAHLFCIFLFLSLSFLVNDRNQCLISILQSEASQLGASQIFLVTKT